ncbi:hypothetical protein [uncultured Megasphaera sp.]|uniref:hypothetical protein n=1 Tax=uncultured Megasphaera sp. TaxID=165188 RepID=UPI002659A6B6|nr:hypothetical protein [uncultured Megasphaera sp.]
MTKQRMRHHDEVQEDVLDLQRQKYIFLGIFSLMLLVLISLYLNAGPVSVSLAIAALIIVTLALSIRYKDFYRLRDRGQRTKCVILSMYASLILTVACGYYFSLEQTLTDEYALVFLFGFLFFTYMVYRTLSPSMVVGNRRMRVKR